MVASLNPYSLFSFAEFCKLFSKSDLLFYEASIGATFSNARPCCILLWLMLDKSCEWNYLCFFFFDDDRDSTPTLQLIFPGIHHNWHTIWSIPCTYLHWQSLYWWCNQIKFLQNVPEIKQIGLVIWYKTKLKIKCMNQPILKWSKICIISQNCFTIRHSVFPLTTSFPIC